MKEYSVEITGVAPLLQHRFAEEEHGINLSRKKKKVYVPEEEAEKALYRDGSGVVSQPSEHVFGAMRKAAVGMIFEGRKTFKDAVTGGIYITPEMIPLIPERRTWDEIDSRGVIIQRSRVIRWRPKFNEWKMQFNVGVINDNDIDARNLKDIMDMAGNIGIGDYRPRYGRFIVTKFEEINDGKVSKQQPKKH